MPNPTEAQIAPRLAVPAAVRWSDPGIRNGTCASYGAGAGGLYGDLPRASFGCGAGVPQGPRREGAMGSAKSRGSRRAVAFAHASFCRARSTASGDLGTRALISALVVIAAAPPPKPGFFLAVPVIARYDKKPYTFLRFPHRNTRNARTHLQLQSRLGQSSPRVRQPTTGRAIAMAHTWPLRAKPLPRCKSLGAGAVPPGAYCQTTRCNLVKRPRPRGLPD